MLSHGVAIGIFALPIVMCLGITRAQDYPSKPIRIISSAVGGSTDITARLVAQGMTNGLGQQVTVDNRPNAAAQGEVVLKAPPDGYTLLVAGGSFWTFPLLQKTVYDPLKDFAPVSLIEVSVSVVAVHPSFPVKSIKEMIALAKARPGEINASSSGSGSTSHLSLELFKYLAGVNIVHVPYKSNSIAILDLIGGQIQLAFPSAIVASQHVQAGRLRTLAVTSAQPSPLAPGLPPIAATVPGYESVSMTGIFAPAKTPTPVITRLNQEVVRYVKTPEVKEMLFSRGAETVGSTPEQFGVAMAAELDRLSKLIKVIGLRAD